MPSVDAADSSYVATCLLKNKANVGFAIDSLLGPAGDALNDHVESFLLGHYVIAVVVSGKSPTRSVRTDELSGIFRGTVTSWADNEASGNVRRIELFSPLLCTTQSYIFQRCVMHGNTFAKTLMDQSTKSCCQKHSTSEIVKAVMDDRGAVGFLQLGPSTVLDKRIRLLRVVQNRREAPVPPSLETIADGSYPITDQLILYLHPDAPVEAKEFCKFACGKEDEHVETPPK
jgi:phosphate transport system substrate-binding protein